MNFNTRPHFVDRQIVQYPLDTITLSGENKYSSTGYVIINPTVLDFTGTTTAQTTVTINTLTGYLNDDNRLYGLRVSPPILKLSATTATTTVDVTGMVLRSADAFGNVEWGVIGTGATDTNTFVTGGTLSGETLLLYYNNGNSAQPINLSNLVFTGNTSGSCISDLYVTNVHGCSPITFWDSVQSLGSNSSGLLSYSFGFNNISSGDYSHAEGSGTTTNGIASHAEGLYTIANGDYSHAEGGGNITYGLTSHAEGGFYLSKVPVLSLKPNIAYGVSNHVEGANNITSGSCSHAEGYSTSATTFHAHAEGSGTLSSGDSSHAEGIGTIANGDSSHAEGRDTIAIGDSSHSEGKDTNAGGYASHSEGEYTNASGYASHAEGFDTISSGYASHAEGEGPVASGYASHAEGLYTIASGDYSHTQGSGTIASGDYSHAGGKDTIASGNYSFIHSNNSLISGDNSVILGGVNITGVTNNTVYIPNLIISGNHVLHSDTRKEISDIPNIESSIKGSITEFNWSGVTSNVLSNNNTSGYTSFLLGDLSVFPSQSTYGFLSYYGSNYSRTGFNVNGNDFYSNKLVLKTGNDSNGLIINPKAGDPLATLWFEIDGSSIIKLKGDGSGGGYFGLALNPNGVENPTSTLQIGGTGTTGTFKYKDGNEQNGYILTSDSDGNATWQPSSGGGGVNIDPYEIVPSGTTTINWDVSGTSTNYETILTANTTLNLSNVRNGDYGTFIVTQDSIGGNSLTLGTVNGVSGNHKVVNGGGGVIVLTGSANSTDIITFTYNGNTVWWSIGPNYT